MKTTSSSVGLACLILLIPGIIPSIYGASHPGYGIQSWAGWKPDQITKEECPALQGVPLILHWNEVEPELMDYKFDEYLRLPLESAYAQGLYVSVMIWVGPACPDWLYRRGVPKVYTDRKVNPLGKKMSRLDNRFPYYFDETYKEAFFDLVNAFGTYVDLLPPKLKERILYIQSCEGSTGDGQPYKGNPLRKEFEISSEDWNEYRLQTWKLYQQNFPDTPILVNSDANDEEKNAWLLENMNVIALKHGMFSHGYHVSDNVARLETFKGILKEAAAAGKPVLTRGEMDGELFVMGWSKQNLPRALYWSGLFATHCGLDIWNIPYKALKDEKNTPAFQFFNKYAGYRNAATSPFAFCALRDGLDASDFDRFPETSFGGKPGKKNDLERTLAIAGLYARQGARMEDPEKALQDGMMNRKRSGSNDVGWGILPGNYERFLSQVEPGSGDIGLWNVDDTIFGRFARRFDHASSKTFLGFKLNEAFPPPDTSSIAVSLTVVWLDKGVGEWSLNYRNEDGGTESICIRNTDTGSWSRQTFKIPALFVGGSGTASDFMLKYVSGEDTIFHMVEIERE